MLPQATPSHELKWLHHALNITHAAIYEWDLVDGTLSWSESAAQLLPFASAQPMKAEAFESCIEASQRVVLQAQRVQTPPTEQYSLEYTLTLPGGGHVSVMERGQAIVNDAGKVVRLMGMILPKAGKSTDSTNQMLIESVLEEAYHYPASFLTALEQAMEALGDKPVLKGALLIIGIDNLPMVIQGHGHEKAEAVLSELHVVLDKQLPLDATLFRIQRDQFAVISPELSRLALPGYVKELRAAMKVFSSNSKEMPLHIVPSIGSALFEDALPAASPKARATDLIDSAFVALKAHSPYLHSMYDEGPETADSSIRHMEMANYIHNAIHEGKLQLAYQPIINAKTGAVSHYECLLRLRGDDGKLTSAGALIPIAERMGMIDIIDQLVLEMVVEDLLRCPDVHLAFNISNLTTNNPEWLDLLVRILEETPEIAPRMIVEVTETAAQRDLKESAYFVASIQALGCKVSLDDFGSGYTSFRQLKALSCDTVKIDGSFIRDIEKNPDNRFFVKTLLEFIHSFGLEAVAEMVETGEAAKILMDLGVHYMQGYYFGKPYDERVWLKAEPESKTG